ncbi:MAG: archaemetzincin family Zn-dependent metalloprotease [Candidatus Korarchaeota archaeon]|nr:archaemetzincin family Zn-dependent metalloprotease [Candidatus Korarchaeota archaeon]NIU84175.1 archaemetzincin family Zn-dependent metalloprotease [Candidatus Thorarchaeota archaeon]NIW14320.1 archaemetzincin family Zn-dependent metalloprotease [Candidatus Thorarchaeota archaeon]NIW52417.1 archaemetzincin family Zn-dependent metalloprotease [Candidatus Korarchaeota archaeon]
MAGNVLEEMYPVTAVVRNSLPIPQQTFNEVRGQYNAPALLSYVKKEKKSRYAFALTEKDLWSGRLNFVFGQAIPGEAAILSVSRLEDEHERFKERVKKEIIHEMGHVLGLSHCTNQSCVMRFSNSLKEVDRKNATLCEQCRNDLLK